MGELEELRKQSEELRKQLEAIELEKQKRLIEEMKVKVEEDKKLEMQRHDEELLAKHGITSKSKIADDTPSKAMNLARDNEHIQFGEAFIQRRKNQGLKMEGLPYERLIEKLAYKEYAKRD